VGEKLQAVAVVERVQVVAGVRQHGQYALVAEPPGKITSFKLTPAAQPENERRLRLPAVELRRMLLIESRRS
jgi:hypothetical protein